MSPLKPPRLADCNLAEVLRAMRGEGLWLDVGSATVRLQGESAPLARQVQTVYANYPLVTQGNWADVHVQMPGNRVRMTIPYRA